MERSFRCTSCPKDSHDRFESHPVCVVEVREVMRVDVEHADELVAGSLQRHDDLRSGPAVAGDVTRKRVDVGDDDGFASVHGRPADTLMGSEDEAGQGTLVRIDDELVVSEHVEASPGDAWGFVVDEGGGGGSPGRRVGGGAHQVCELIADAQVPAELAFVRHALLHGWFGVRRQQGAARRVLSASAAVGL